MPEGDTVYRHAALLRPLLVGGTITHADSRWPEVVRGVAGRTIVSVESLGKNLLITLSDDTVLRVHLGMKGTWRQYQPREPLLRSPGELALLLCTDAHQVACWSAPTVEHLRAGAVDVYPPLASLGPDLLRDPVDFDEIMARARRSAAPTLAELLLDQRVAAGIGNVYKSELCFLHGLDPFGPPGVLDDRTLTAIFVEARALLRRNLGGGPRDTTFLGPRRPRQWVYGRGGRGCLRCATPIATRVHGDTLPRSTWWCPGCQPPVG